MKIILGSSSPRRQALFQRLNINFDIINPNLDESIIKFNGDPNQYCTSLAQLKAKSISRHHPKHLVVGADTIVVIDNNLLCKPINKNDAINMIKSLSGRTHQVYTGVSLQCIEKNIQHQFSEITSVTFKILEEWEILYYIRTYQPYDKSGSYGIQDWSAIFVEGINGCYDNVVGFPLSRFYEKLKEMNINLLDSKS